MVEDANTDTLSNTLFTSLTSGHDFSVPTVDFEDPLYNIPATNSFDTSVEATAYSDVSTGVVNGDGVFDKMFVTLREHLAAEFAAQRLSKAAMGEVLAAVIPSLMSQAINFAAMQEQVKWQTITAQQQAKAAQAQATQTQLQVAQQKAALRAAEADAQTQAANFALAKQRLSIEEAQYDILRQQLINAQAELVGVQYRNEHLLPEELLSAQAARAQTEAQTVLIGLQQAHTTAQTTHLGKQTLQVEAQTLNVAKEGLHMDAQTTHLGKQTLHTEAQTTHLGKQTLLVEAQTTHQAKETLQTEAQTAHTTTQTAHVAAQTDVTEYELANLLPKELAIKTYQLENIMPRELSGLEAKELQTEAQTAQVVYETANILPEKLAAMQKETAVKNYQLTDVMPAQVASMTAETLSKTYTNDFLLPAQLENLLEQIEVNRAKTLDTRRDGVTPIAGAVGVQKDLQNEQKISYQRDREAKIMKMLLDTWTVSKSIDEGLAPPTALQDAQLNSVVSAVRTNLGI